jgi:hypothetical protein
MAPLSSDAAAIPDRPAREPVDLSQPLLLNELEAAALIGLPVKRLRKHRMAGLGPQLRKDWGDGSLPADFTAAIYRQPAHGRQRGTGGRAQASAAELDRRRFNTQSGKQALRVRLLPTPSAESGSKVRLVRICLIG